MSGITTQTVQRPVPIIGEARAVANGVTYSFGRFDAWGMARVTGNFRTTAAITVTIEQSRDGTNWYYVETVTRDASQANFQYPFTVDMLYRYLRIRVANASGGDVTVDSFAELFAMPASG